jgi:hypothetical protein
VHQVVIAATALGYGFTALTDDGDYAHQIAAVRPDLRVRMVGDGPGCASAALAGTTARPGTA